MRWPSCPRSAAAERVLHLHPARFDPLAALAEWQQGLTAAGAEAPAAEAHFIGRVRGRTASGAPLEALELEHYPGMTEAQIERIAATITSRHGLLAVRVDHRVGRVLPGEAIVLVAVAADRRGPAQRGGQELLEALKHEAPFWKREWSGGLGTWVEGNTAF
ncbi:molybdenum cofactor biosynthesis protein MoaE [Synechococcus sp. BSF8S]|uniref:molybdopterin synthase catalytic subunit n=1 Tax=Synechococcales TaxID=1890424 RepID=UPI001625B498|nr:molybdenum cofactor biosynthesis protein MoaE [Synechococcus sp. BSF8S]MBC1260436.1 molybdenum cofactor biosynthesis protein MoaE [Synechococcus sp. BSF8S]MBC1263807.1 molybdenum cofactor biosynthesis protein MoaE [Synechococcus sp. BSA11S]